MKPEEQKMTVKEKYGQIARQSLITQKQNCCCGGSGDGNAFNMIGDEYHMVKGYNPDADLKLGCGLPTEYSGIKKGDHVLDLGCGAGNDCFIAAELTGETGKVTGLDFSEDMLVKANRNLEKTGFKNIDFVYGDIENIPLDDNLFDVVISNCVLNLVPDKRKAFSEIHRVLKPGGHFCVSDIVVSGELPDDVRKNAENYAGCIAGAQKKDEYLDNISAQGFKGIEICKERKIDLPLSFMLKYYTDHEIKELEELGRGIYSITVVANK